MTPVEYNYTSVNVRPKYVGIRVSLRLLSKIEEVNWREEEKRRKKRRKEGREGEREGRKGERKVGGGRKEEGKTVRGSEGSGRQ